MKKGKIVIAIPSEEEFVPSFKRWGQSFDWSDKEVCLVHVVRKNVYNQIAGIREAPSPEEFESDRPKILEFLAAVAKEIVPNNENISLQFQTLLSVSPVEAMADFLTETSADLVVVATRKKSKFQNIFMSSFSDHLVQLSPCDILILRPTK